MKCNGFKINQKELDRITTIKQETNNRVFKTTRKNDGSNIRDCFVYHMKDIVKISNF